ncbi:very short patch repair endonuclease [Burkholderia ubonensis]|nr:very short patch repair endonuclease [Burkholderia ubonensis]KVD51745.1 very short patch repair endonuclease [Burkholderia ubonensis]
MDRLSPEKRSWLMSRVGSKNTKPERTVRQLLHRLGYRFRLHCKDLPGTPDVVFPKRRKALFVHGCFWHGHDQCRYARLPSTKVTYWSDKIAKNRLRDARNVEMLASEGWQVLVIWQCELKNVDLLVARLVGFLGPQSVSSTRR